MDLADVKAMLDVVKEPAVTSASRQMDEFRDGGTFRRMAREAQEAQRWWPDLRALSGQLKAAEAAERVSRLAGWRDSQRLLDEIRERHSATFDAQTRLAEMLESSQVVNRMTRDLGSVLSGYASHFAAVESDYARAAEWFSSDVSCAIASDFDRLRDASTAFFPLQDLSTSLATSLGSALDENALAAALSARYDMEPVWLQEFRSLEALVRDTWDFDVQDDDEEADGNLSDLSVESQGPSKGDADAVFEIAVRYGSASLKFDDRVRRIASRIDPLAMGTGVTWDRMLLIIGHGYPQYAERLMRVAYPYLQSFAWSTAPRGTRVGGATESLAFEDVEDFELLNEAMVDLLEEIEASDEA